MPLNRALAPTRDSSQRLTHLQAAALDERYALQVDAAIADCFRVDPGFVTRRRQAEDPGYALLRRRWLTEGDALLARRQAQDARLSADRHRRLREMEALRERQPSGGVFRFAPPQKVTGVPPEQVPPERLSWVERFGKDLLGFFGQDTLIIGFLLLATVYLGFGVLYPGGWTGAWSDWMGVNQ